MECSHTFSACSPGGVPVCVSYPLSSSQLSVLLESSYFHVGRRCCFTPPSYSNSPGGNAGPILWDADEEDGGGRTGPILSVVGATMVVPWCRDDNEEVEEGGSSGPTMPRTAVAGPSGAVRIFGFFVLGLIIVVLTAVVDRAAVTAAANDGGKVGPIVTAAREGDCCCSVSRVRRGRFLWFWYDVVVVVVPTTTPAVFDDLLTPPPSPSSSSCAVVVRAPNNCASRCWRNVSKAGIGCACGRRRRINANAASYRMLRLVIKYSRTAMVDRDTPRAQWTKTFP